MHVCGSHEQAIARFGLRARFPKDLNVIMGPGCPVCITDLPEVDEGVALALDDDDIAVARADVKTFEILGVGGAKRNQSKRKNTSSRYESVQNTPHPCR